MFEIDLAEFVPADTREARDLMLHLPPQAFLGENPVSATLVVAGSADDVHARLAEMKHPQNPKALRHAKALYDAWIAFYRGSIDKAHEEAVRLFEGIGMRDMGMSAPASVPAGAEVDPAPLQKLGAAYLICCLARYEMRRYHVDAAIAYMRELMEGEGCFAQAAAIDLSMYEMSVGVLADIPAWIKTGDLGVGRVGDRLLFTDGGVHPQNLYAALLAAAQFKNYQGEYLESLAIIDVAERVYGLRSVVIGEVYFALYRALNEEALGYPDVADAHLKQAVDLVHKDGLWQIIAEFAGGFDGRLLALVEKSDPAGAAVCERTAEGLLERIRQSHEDEKDKRGYQKLTEQELAVMRLVAAGRNNKEISDELHISNDTVKFHKRNASFKLGTRARASSVEIKEALERQQFSAEWLS